MRLGEKQVLTVVKKVDFGVYLGSDEERVLLPKKQVPEEIEVGDPVEVTAADTRKPGSPGSCGCGAHRCVP